MKFTFINRTYILWIVIVACFSSCKTTHKTDTAENSSWEVVKAGDASIPVKRHEAAFVNIKDKFYLLGGRGIRPVSIYDTKTHKWTKGAKPPIEMHHFQPVIYKSKIYIIGAMTGYYPGESPVSHIYIYDPLQNNWSKGDKIPESRQRGSTGNVIYKSKVYIACGIKDGHRGDHKKWMDSYDLITGKWEVLEDAPNARDHFQAALIDGEIYTLAGRQSKAPDETFKHTLGKVDVFNIKENKWHTLEAKLPTQRAGNMVVTKGQEIWVVGGESDNQKTAHAEVEVLNTVSCKWHSLPKLNKGRHGTGVIDYKGAFYVASGSGNKGGSPELEDMEKLSY